MASWFNEDGPWCIEGVAAVRALRKWLAYNEGKPCDVVYWMPVPKKQLTPKQRGMYLGCQKVWEEIKPVLQARGVKLIAA